jgi:putative flippase GtrA
VSKLKSEVQLNGRYAVAGIINGAVGLTTIWGLSILNAPPIAANFLGYVLSLLVGYLSARSFVFRSKGQLSQEAIRYLVSFILCYVINVITLHMCINKFALGTLVSQVIAVSSYIVSMYLVSRLFVFSRSQFDRN